MAELKVSMYLVMNYTADLDEANIVWREDGKPHLFMTDKEAEKWAKLNLSEEWKVIEI